METENVNGLNTDELADEEDASRHMGAVDGVAAPDEVMPGKPPLDALDDLTDEDVDPDDPESLNPADSITPG